MSWWRSGEQAKRADADPPRERLLEVAQAEAAAHGWPWLEPIEITLDSVSDAGRIWSVRTNRAARGMNVRVTIREGDFSVVSAGFLSR
jgi:hypothetical protein